MKNQSTQDIVAVINTLSGPIIILVCIVASFFLLNAGDRSNLLMAAIGSGSAMWQHQSRRETSSSATSDDGRGSGRFSEEVRQSETESE